MATYWVSFATEEKFLGVAVVDIDDENASAEDVIRETSLAAATPATVACK